MTVNSTDMVETIADTENLDLPLSQWGHIPESKNKMPRSGGD